MFKFILLGALLVMLSNTRSTNANAGLEGLAPAYAEGPILDDAEAELIPDHVSRLVKRQVKKVDAETNTLEHAAIPRQADESDPGPEGKFGKCMRTGTGCRGLAEFWKDRCCEGLICVSGTCRKPPSS